MFHEGEGVKKNRNENILNLKLVSNSRILNKGVKIR